jgi:transposase
MAGIVQFRHDTPGRACYRRKLAAGKTSMEATRCLRRRLSDAVYRQLTADARALEDTGPGGHSGATLLSSAADLPPGIGTSDQPLPGPAHPTLATTSAAVNPWRPGIAATPRQRAGGVNVQRPQRASARTNDIDTGQRRRSLNSARPPA